MPSVVVNPLGDRFNNLVWITYWLDLSQGNMQRYSNNNFIQPSPFILLFWRQHSKLPVLSIPNLLTNSVVFMFMFNSSYLSGGHFDVFRSERDNDFRDQVMLNNLIYLHSVLHLSHSSWLGRLGAICRRSQIFHLGKALFAAEGEK